MNMCSTNNGKYFTKAGGERLYLILEPYMKELVNYLDKW